MMKRAFGILLPLLLVPLPAEAVRLKNAACGAVAMTACHANTLTASAMYQAVPIIRAVKDRGGFRDLGHCEDIARHVADFTAVVGYGLASVIAGKCGECACRLAY